VAHSASDIAETYDEVTAATAKAAVTESWNPDAFTELCRRASGNESDLSKLWAQVNAAEWKILFEECCHGKPRSQKIN
jgi:hypothetical protein